MHKTGAQFKAGIDIITEKDTCSLRRSSSQFHILLKNPTYTGLQGHRSAFFNTRKGLNTPEKDTRESIVYVSIDRLHKEKFVSSVCAHFT